MIDCLAVIGVGGIGGRHVQLARELLPGAKIIVVTRDSRSAGRLPPGVTAFADVESCLAAGPQAAVVANPATLHVETATQLAAAGVHVLVEKPISASAAGVWELLETARQHRALIAVGYNLRFMPSLRKFRELLRSGVAGRVNSVRAEVGQWLPSWRPNADYRESVSACERLGGGVLLELSHEIDYLRWTFGDVGWVSCIALRQGDLQIDVEDTAHLTLGLAGPQGIPVVASLGMDFIRRDPTRCCTAICSEGSLRWNGVADTVELFEPGATAWTMQFRGDGGLEESYRAQMRQFIDCVTHGRQPLVAGIDGLAVVEVVDAARRSSRSGATVRLGPTMQARETGGAA